MRVNGPTLEIRYGAAGQSGSISHPVSVANLAEVARRLAGIVQGSKEPSWHLHIPEGKGHEWDEACTEAEQGVADILAPDTFAYIEDVRA